VNSKLEVHPSARDLRFDTLRGLFLVCMTINHLPTEMREFTDQPVGIFSAAEGFVFLSGLIAGWVYTRKFRELGREGLWNASANRAKSIYRWHVGSVLAAFACVQLTERALGYCSPAVPRLFFEHPLESLGLGVSLLYQPGLLDLLPMYCAFVMLLPVVIRSLEAGRKWLVLGTSGAVWLAVQWAPPVDGAPLYPINTGSFNLFAWQFLFIVGVTIGHARISGSQQVVRPNPWVVACAAAVTIYGFGLHHYQWIRLWPEHAFGMLLNKPALGLFRMADFGCVAYLVGIFGAQFPKALTWRPLAFLGQHSLAVVATQSVTIMALLQFSSLFDTVLSRTLTAAVVIGMLFVVAGARQAVIALGSSSGATAPIGTRQPADPHLVRPDDARAA
jgi:hypothetical protein